jgi:hypothetical protein
MVQGVDPENVASGVLVGHEGNNIGTLPDSGEASTLKVGTSQVRVGSSESRASLTRLTSGIREKSAKLNESGTIYWRLTRGRGANQHEYRNQ